MRKAIKIIGDASGILSVNLNDILNCINNAETINWGLLWIEAVAELDSRESILDFERKVNKSEDVTMIAWQKLLELSTQIIQSVELLIIGDDDKGIMRRYSTDEEMYNSCTYVIELIDSSYWIIHSKDVIFLRNIFENLDGVEYLEL